MDLGLNVLDTEANQLNICNLEPVTYASATSTNSLGVKTSFTIGAPSDRTPTGRRVTTQLITDGVINVTGTASHWAIVDTVNARLLATGSLASSQSVTNGNTFSLPGFDIGIPDAA
jgi:hypothetical protein